MGSVCSCFRDDQDPPENDNAINSNINGFFHTLFNKYTAKFNKEDIQATITAPKDITQQLSDRLEAEICYLYASKDDEDVCPTCLEDYSFDNPRIVTQCNHHYHLGCIYDWMERSKTCPLCFKVMIFDETR